MSSTLPKRPPLPTNLVPVPPERRKGFKFQLPLSQDGVDVPPVYATWADWAAVHARLGQELAKRMREYGGPAKQDDPPPGGTPVLMRAAA